MTEAVQYTATKAKPFLKWVGGKRYLAPTLESNAPVEFKDYYEPMFGGGALFYHLLNRGKLTYSYISDINLELMITYDVVKKYTSLLVDRLRDHKANHNKEYYYTVRSWHNLTNEIEIAARMIYLNKTGYNGLYRVNKKGEFNVPMGDYKNPNIVQEDVLRAASDALWMAHIDTKAQGYDSIEPSAGDFVYLDPPYHPITDNFTAYTKLDFTEADQEALRDFVLRLHEQGVYVMVTNSPAQLIRDLYSRPPFRIQSVSAPRSINRNGAGRGAVEELLITTY